MKVGIIGSGQLARLLITENAELNHDFHVIANNDTAKIADMCHLTIDEKNDESTLKAFCNNCDVITFENENIPASHLTMLETHFSKKIHPKATIISQFNDRIKEKDCFRFLRIPTNKYHALYSKDHAISAANELSFPVVLKQRTNTYDGKGQHLLKTMAELEALTDYPFSNAILEEFVDFDGEVALTACRDKLGNTVFYDMSYNIAEKGLLRVSQNIKEHPLLEKAKSYLQRLVTATDYVGCCTLEFFQKGDELIANEFSPRVHNSAHWTIDATNCNQFQNHIRAITGQSVADPASFTDATMLNVISTHPESNLPASVKYYDYQKEAKPNRKLGHITLLRSAFDNTSDYLNAVNKLTNQVYDKQIQTQKVAS